MVAKIMIDSYGYPLWVDAAWIFKMYPFSQLFGFRFLSNEDDNMVAKIMIDSC